MAQIDIGNQFMSLSTLANSKCKASLQTKGMNACRWEETLCGRGALLF